MTEIPDTVDELLARIDAATEQQASRKKARKRLLKMRCYVCGEKIGPGSYVSTLEGPVHIECERGARW